MRICYVFPGAVPSNSPASIQIEGTLSALSSHSMQTHLVSYIGQNDQKLNITSASFQHHTIQQDNKRSNYNLYKAAKKIAEEQCADFIYTRNLKAALFFKRFTRIRVVFESHEIFFISCKEFRTYTKLFLRPLQCWKLRLLEKRVYANVDALVFLTNALRDDAKRCFKFSAPSIIAPDGANEVSLKKNATKNNHVLYLGSLHKWKGVETLIKASASIDALVIIAGGNPSEIKKLKSFAHDLSVLDKVSFIGYVNATERFKLIENCSIAVLPLNGFSIASKYTSPLKLFEYMSYGKAIVASNLPSIREVLKDHVNALLFEPSNSDSLAERINQLLSNKELAEKISANAHQDFIEKYTWDIRAMRILRLLHLLSA